MNDDDVDEASLESFPASDPPSFTTMHAGAPPRDEPKHEEEPQRDWTWVKRIVIAASVLALGVVVWRIVSSRRR